MFSSVNVTAGTMPGVYVTTKAYGAVSSGLQPWDNCFMLGYSAKAGAPRGVATFIQSPTDFFNVFGISASTNSVKLYFDQLSGAGLYFINVPPRAQRSVTIPTATVGTVYSLTIDGYTLSYTSVTGDTPATILAKLTEEVNTKASHIASLSNGTLRYATSLTVTASASVTLGTANTAATPNHLDVLDCVANVDADSLPAGFLIAPEFYQGLTQLSQHQALANGLGSYADMYGWQHIADCMPSTASITGGLGLVNAASQERANIVSSSAGYVAPYWKSIAGALVPASASVAGMAIKRYRAEGLHQPPAGVQFPIRGVVDTSVLVTDKMQSQLNPIGVNCLRKLSRRRGTVVYGARTCSNDPAFKYIHQMVILKTLARTLRDSLQNAVFTTYSSVAGGMTQVKLAAIEACEDMRLLGGLFGASPEEAYLVICDMTNNPPSSLEQGNLNLDVFVKVSPVAEFVNINLQRTALGVTLTTILTGGAVPEEQPEDE